jgi:hypothetical protein
MLTHPRAAVKIGIADRRAPSPIPAAAPGAPDKRKTAASPRDYARALENRNREFIDRRAALFKARSNA